MPPENADERSAMIEVEKVLSVKDPNPDFFEVLKAREVSVSSVDPKHFDSQEKVYARRRPSAGSLNFVLALANQREKPDFPRYPQ